MQLLLCASLAIADFATAIPTNDHVLHEQRTGVPVAWKRASRAPEHHVLPMPIVLKQQNCDQIKKFLLHVSDPGSANYGKHWSPEKVADTFAASLETSDVVANWLGANDIPRERLAHSKGRNWIEFNATIGEAERLLQTEYHVFQHEQSRGHRVACDEYSLPKAMLEHVDFVMPTAQLDGLRPISPKRSVQQGPAPTTDLSGIVNCDQIITTDCLRSIYNFGKGKYDDTSNKLGIFADQNWLHYGDLEIFFRDFSSPPIPDDTRPELLSAVGAYNNKYAPEYGNNTHNRTGRGYPDVSALGENLLHVIGGNVEPGGETSASVPIVASLFTLLNEERLRANKTSIGFANPVFYKHPEMFHDVAEGSNPGCGTDGFPASGG